MAREGFGGERLERILIDLQTSHARSTISQHSVAVATLKLEVASAIYYPTNPIIFSWIIHRSSDFMR